ncbi:MAG: hypothetical protein ACLRRT_13990 [Ruthenibacterium lactatiformans]
MGGGTYARRFANAISYGPGETDQPACLGGRPTVRTGHGNGAIQALRIYILAIARLMKLEL